MAKVQNSWQSIVDRLKNDTDFNDYFAGLFYAKQTEQISEPYAYITPGTHIFQSAATFGSNLTNEIEANYSGEIVASNEDDEVAVNQLVLGCEIFVNAFEDTDITHSSKFQGDFVITFGEVTVLEGQENTFSWPFSITVKIQPYTAGEL